MFRFGWRKRFALSSPRFTFLEIAHEVSNWLGVALRELGRPDRKVSQIACSPARGAVDSRKTAHGRKMTAVPKPTLLCGSPLCEYKTLTVRSMTTATTPRTVRTPSWAFGFIIGGGLG